MTERLAIVGASTRAAAASAVRAGFQLVGRRSVRRRRPAPHRHGHANLAYPDGFVDWLARRSKPAAWMYTGALENHPELVDQMAAIAPLWGNPGDVLRQVRSPWELADALRRYAACCFPKRAPSPDGLPRDGSWLAKTVPRRQRQRRAGAVDGELPRRQARGSSSSFVYQRRIAGVPCSAVYRRQPPARLELLGVVRQLVGENWLGAREFQYCRRDRSAGRSTTPRATKFAGSATCWRHGSSWSACLASTSSSTASECGPSKSIRGTPRRSKSSNGRRASTP